MKNILRNFFVIATTQQNLPTKRRRKEARKKEGNKVNQKKSFITSGKGERRMLILFGIFEKKRKSVKKSKKFEDLGWNLNIK